LRGGKSEKSQTDGKDETCWTSEKSEKNDKNIFATDARRCHADKHR
jgi:hypothetical protein